MLIAENAVHPGEVLREEFLAPHGITPNALAIALRVPATRISDIVRERRGLSPDTALRLARYFSTSAEFWMNLQKAWELSTAARDHGRKIEAEVRPLVA